MAIFGFVVQYIYVQCLIFIIVFEILFCGLELVIFFVNFVMFGYFYFWDFGDLQVEDNNDMGINDNIVSGFFIVYVFIVILIIIEYIVMLEVFDENGDLCMFLIQVINVQFVFFVIFVGDF